ncbi:hypothetical protein NG895_15855 [Aeoliella sp. ICT_H6.2]|uniref:Uncharacterized protein n=1 Tax=Aeoliella straminimaris TaxID=2954799 RepID=A0A9X2FBB6_9BACT|nr:hypothetical protein [Aeoliella straminimaris]MCO6045384.1 hypothetical protein [Aeoliella straminimaris]
MYLKACFVIALIAVVEMLHGVWRVRVLNPRFGDRKARQLGLISGSALILLIAWLTTPWMGLSSAADCWVVGLLWVAVMLAFDVAVGRLLFKMKWQRILRDFDPRQGGYMALGMLFVLLAPFLAAWLHGFRGW